MNRKTTTLVCTGLFAAVLGTLAQAAPGTYQAVTSATALRWNRAASWTLISGDPAPLNFPTYAHGDTAIIPSGAIITNLATTGDGCDTLIIQAGGTFINNQNFQVRAVQHAGTFSFTNGGSMNFNGTFANPASWSGNGATLNRVTSGAPGTTGNLQIQPDGWMQISSPLRIYNSVTQPGRLRVGVDCTLEFLAGSAGITGIGQPATAALYSFDVGGAIVYNTGGTIMPGREWPSYELMGNNYRGPESVVVASGTVVDMVNMPDGITTNPPVLRTGTYPIEGVLTVEPGGVLIDANNEAGIVLDNAPSTTDGTLDLQAGGEIRKTKNSSSAQWLPLGTLLNYGIAGAQLDFRTRTGGTFVRTHRFGNPGTGFGGTITSEHYAFATDASPFAIRRMGLPDRGVALVPPAAICVHDETELPPGISDSCLSTALTSVAGGIVTHNSSAQAANDVTDIADNLYYVKDAATPLLVDLVSFEAVPGANGEVTLVWETASEIDNVGFHVARSDADGNITEPLTAIIIPAEGSAFQGAVYTFNDPTLLSKGETRHYILQDVDLDGHRTNHGPVSATRPNGKQGRPKNK